MIDMRITFYPSLRYALETLRENEYLYTHSWINTLKIRYKYKKKSNEYEPASIKKRQEPFRYGRYEHFLFRKGVVEDLVEGLISAVENNSEVFKVPLKEAISLGLNEFYTKLKDKDFVCVKSAEPLYPRVYVVGKSYDVNEPISMSIKEEKWKEGFLNLGTIEESVNEEITEKIKKMKGLKPGRTYHGWGEYRWIDVLIVADKELVNGKGRVLAKFWENDNILGIDKLANTLLSDWESESVSELKSILRDNIERFGLDYVKESLSKMVLGGICMHLSGLPRPEETEVVLVPFNIEDENEKGDKEVEFLVLARLKIGDRSFSWMPTNVNYDDKKFNSSEAIQHGTRKLMRVVDREKMPVELSKEKGKAILINTELTEDIMVSKNQQGGKDIEIEKIKYRAETEDLKFVRVGLEDSETLSVKEYKEIEERKVVDEEVVIEATLRGVMKDLGCEEIVNEPVKKQIEELDRKIHEQGREEKDPEKKNGIRLAEIVLKRLLKAMEEGKIRKKECMIVGRSIYLNTYRHKIYPDVALEGKELLTEAIKDFPEPEISRRAKKPIELLEVEKDKKLCFKNGGLEKRIDVIEGIDEILKEPFVLYIKSLSGALSKMLENRISNVKGVSGELEEINKLSVALSGVVTSVIGKFPDLNETSGVNAKIEEMTKEIYEVLFRSMVGGEIRYYDYGENFGWIREKDTFLNWRALMRDMVGLRVRVNITETITVEVYEAMVAVMRRLTTSTRKDYGEDLWAVYLDSGYKGKLVEMTVVK